MKNEFTRWLSSMSFQEDASFTDQRWDAINSLLVAVNVGRLALLARLAFHLKQPMGSPEVAELRNVFAGHTPPPGDEELSLLSASALAIAMDSDTDAISALAATIVACIACTGLRKLKQPMDLVGMSDNVLRSLADTSRRRPSIAHAKLVTPTVDMPDLSAMTSSFQPASVESVLQSVVAATNKTLGAMARRQREFEVAVQKFVNVQDEELDILWWLEGGHSFDLGADFLDTLPQYRPLGIAHELASLTKVLPGPPAIQSLLSRTGIPHAEPQSIPDAVQCMPIDWLSKTVESLEVGRLSAHLTPILFAVHRRQEVDGIDKWIDVWCAATGLSREVKLEPLQLAVAAYREFSLVRMG